MYFVNYYDIKYNLKIKKIKFFKLLSVLFTIYKKWCKSLLRLKLDLKSLLRYKIKLFYNIPKSLANQAF